jgi:hypothetical protein
MDQELTSPVWQLHGALTLGAATPGQLKFKEAKVSFVTQEAEQFTVPSNEMKEVKRPFSKLGSGFSAVVNGKKYKFSLVDPDDYSFRGSFRYFIKGRKMAKKRKAILGK